MKKLLAFIRSKQQQTVLVWLAVYPIITGLVWLLDPFLQPLQLPIRTLVLSALMVPIMVYGAMPLINHVVQKFDAANSQKHRQTKRQNS